MARSSHLTQRLIAPTFTLLVLLAAYLMLLGMRGPLRPGDSFDVTFQFAKAPALTFKVAVR